MLRNSSFSDSVRRYIRRVQNSLLSRSSSTKDAVDSWLILKGRVQVLNCMPRGNSPSEMTRIMPLQTIQCKHPAKCQRQVLTLKEMKKEGVRVGSGLALKNCPRIFVARHRCWKPLLDDTFFFLFFSFKPILSKRRCFVIFFGRFTPSTDASTFAYRWYIYIYVYYI